MRGTSQSLNRKKQPLFALGRLVATPEAMELLTLAQQTPLEFLARDLRGDWSEYCAEDATENDFFVKANFPSLQAATAYAMAKSLGSLPKPTAP